MSEGTVIQVLAGEAQWAVVHSDCLDVLRTLPDECVDAIVTDAPYGLSKITEENVRDALACWLRGEPYLSKSRGFMGRTWDRFVPGPEVWRECCRVLRPGGYLLTFAGTRTEDLMGIAVRLGGFERVDTLAWLHGCLSADTEALTRRGWLRYDQISDDDDVMQWESSTGSLSWVRPLRVVSYDYDGELINIRNRHTDQLLTPNHRVYCTTHKHSGTRRWSDPSVIEAGNLMESQAIDLPMAGLLDGGDPFDPELAYLVGWWLTDAWAHSGVKAVMFSQCKPRTLERLRSALGSHQHSEYVKKAGSPNHNDEHTFYVSGKLADFLLENFSDRELHWDILGWSAEARKRLFDGLMDGDGSMPEGDNSQTFWSKRQERRDVFVALCLSLGMRCYDDPVNGAVYVNTATSTTQVVSRHRKSAPPVSYSGKVWCVTVPTGAFVVRRNGRPFITGNSGFPKSVNIERQIAMHQCTLHGRHFASTLPKGSKLRDGDHLCPETEESRRWKGYGSALKPSHEPILVARKPLRGTYAENVLTNGTAMSIDACRVAHAGSADLEQHAAGVAAIKARGGSMDDSWKNSSDLSGANDVTSAGRWPPNALISHEPGCRRVGTRTVAANPTWDTPNRDTEPSAFTGETVSRVRHGRAGQASAERRYDDAGSTSFAALPGDRRDVEDVDVWSCVEGCAAKALAEQSGTSTSQGGCPASIEAQGPLGWRPSIGESTGGLGDSGTATRFFPQFPVDDEPTFLYQSKPSRAQKDAGLQHFRPRTAAEATHSEDGQQRLESPRTGAGRTGGARNPHPTSKSIDLCRWLTRLVARPGQVVLNPFAGGGSEGVAAVLEGCRWIGVEINDSDEEPFVSIARARLTHIDGGEFIPRESLRAPVNERPKQVTLFG